MSDQTITSLIEKLEGAEVGSRELDCLLATSAGGFVIKGELYGEPAYCRQDDDGSWSHPGQSGDQMVPRYTTSLDAALALAERVLPGWYVGVQANRRYEMPDDWSAYLAPPSVKDCDEVDVDGSTAPLALCAAILRAQSEARV